MVCLSSAVVSADGQDVPLGKHTEPGPVQIQLG